MNREISYLMLINIIRLSLFCSLGDNPDGMYILYSGQLKVTKDGTVLGNVQPLECVGELGFLYGSPRLATVAATQPSTVYYLSKRSFNKIVESVEKSFEKIPLFSVLDVDSKRDMFPAAKILSVGTGDYIARKDDNPTMFFIVLKGLVSFGDKIYRPYDYFGHSELLKSAQYKSSIIVRRTATLLAISNKGFRSSAFSSVRHALTKQQKSAMESEGAQQLQDNGGSPLRRRSSASKNLLSTPSSGISKSPRPSKAFRKADDDGGLVRFEDITTSPDKSAMYSDDNPCIMCVPL